MKQSRKDEQGNFICEECNKTFRRVCNLSLHIGLIHKDKKEYYDKWLKEEDEGICSYCGNETEYIGHWHKYLGYYKQTIKSCLNLKLLFKFIYLKYLALDY